VRVRWRSGDRGSKPKQTQVDVLHFGAEFSSEDEQSDGQSDRLRALMKGYAGPYLYSGKMPPKEN
jgi:hypothetical protein